MVVSKLWLAGHLLPDLKPYTRKGPQGAGDKLRPWERQGAAGGSGSGGQAAVGGKQGGKAAAGGKGAGGGGGASGLPPLLEVLTSQDSISSICGSASMDALGSRASILESITAGSQVGFPPSPDGLLEL